MKMDAVFLFLNNCLNQSLTKGDFVVINNKSKDLPWLQSEEASKIHLFNDEVPIHFPLSLIIGRIQGRSGVMGRTRVEFFLPMKEFLPDHVNSCMSINSGACAAIKELIKTPFVACVNNADIIDMAFVFIPSFLETGTHAVVLGMLNVFVCRYEYKNGNAIHEAIQHFSPFLVRDLFDNPFRKRVWDGIIVIQDLCRSILLTYSSKQGDYFRATKKVHFPSDVWRYISNL